MTSPPRPITVLVVDDEPPARIGLARLVARREGFTVVGECGDGGSAIRAIRDLKPDLVLLDVQMRPPDGFGVVRAIGPEKMPAVIFVTAHDRFAVAAFETHALDYLLKPFSERRIDEALRRARDHFESRRMSDLGQRLLGLLGGSPGGAPPAADQDRIVIRSTGKTEVVPVAEVLRVEAAGYCVRLHTRQRVFVHRESMRSLEARLPASRFVRVHRSTLVNRDLIREARVTRSGEHELVLQDGTRLQVSRSRWGDVSRILTAWESRR
jgi:two-component system LytT family response regulator